MNLDSQLTIMEYNRASEDWYQLEDIFKVAIQEGEQERAIEAYQKLKQAIYIRLSPFYQEAELTRIFASILGGIIHFACKDGGVPSAHLTLFIMQQKEVMQSALLVKEFNLDDAMKIWICSSCELIKSFSTYSYSPVVRRCVQIINNQLCNDICVEQLAKECHVSRQHLSKLFHEETNKTIIEYVQEERIRLAVKMMAADNITITQIAYSCGFKDLNYFTRVFKRVMYQTPKKYQMMKRYENINVRRWNMYTKEDLLKDLHNMGLQHTDAIMVHSSMKSIGPVEGGADTVVDVFMEYFKEGLFMTPTHTWAQMSEEYSLFDPKTEPACVGIIPNIFRKREGVVRSLHPTHSIAAYGLGAAEYVQGEDDVTTPCQPGGCWSRLKDIDAKILMLGCTHIRNTFIHAVEEHLDVPERLTDEPVQFQIKMPDGSIKEVAVHRHYNPLQPHISEEYDKLAQVFYDLGAARKVKFGDAECILCEAKKLYEVTEKVLSHEINCLIDRKEIPREWWEE